MPIKTIPVKTEMETLYCDCGGLMKFTGRSLMSSPPKYVHLCRDCKKKEVTLKVYPYITHVPIASKLG